MKVDKISEYGYEEAVLGFSLSYNTSIERVKQILPKYAFGIPGENKFLESMIVYVDVTAPRYWYQEFDTYRVGITKQSASTMHTITKRNLAVDDFEHYISAVALADLNDKIEFYRAYKNVERKKEVFLQIKGDLPEGFLQRRICMISYKTLQNMYVQRYNHRLPQWRYFFNQLVPDLDHPEFIERDEDPR